MPHRIWIHESNIVSAEPVIENTEAVVVAASHFTDHTAELRLMKRDIAKLQSQLKQVRSQNKALEKDIKQRDDWLKKDSLLMKKLKEDYDSLSKEHNKFKEKAATDVVALLSVVKKYENILDRCVEVGYVRSYTKASELRLEDLIKSKIDSEICITENGKGVIRTYEMMIEEMRECEKKIIIQRNIINSLQGKETKNLKEYLSSRDDYYNKKDGTKIHRKYNIIE